MDIRRMREKKLLTQRQLASLISVDRTLVSKIESGSAMPSVKTAKRIAAVLGFDWTLFFDADSWDAKSMYGQELLNRGGEQV